MSFTIASYIDTQWPEIWYWKDQSRSLSRARRYTWANTHAFISLALLHYLQSADAGIICIVFMHMSVRLLLELCMRPRLATSFMFEYICGWPFAFVCIFIILWKYAWCWSFIERITLSRWFCRNKLVETVYLNRTKIKYSSKIHRLRVENININ